MAKHTQTIPRQFATNCLSMFDHFVGLALKGLKNIFSNMLSNTFSDFILDMGVTDHRHYDREYCRK